MNEIIIPSHIKGLIFDIDGTLADTMPLHFKATQLVSQKYGFEFPLDYFLAKAGIPTHKVFEMLIHELGLTHLNAHAIAEEKEKVFLTLVHNAKPIKVVADVVYKYQDQLPMALGTGANKELAESILKAIGMRNLFEVIITCEDVVHPKPSPDTFLKGAAQIGIDPKFCLVFEDGEPGIIAAKAGGMEVIDVRPYFSANITI
jgi:HAD superfamily hydrolase (TIGR01509 family)